LLSTNLVSKSEQTLPFNLHTVYNGHISKKLPLVVYLSALPFDSSFFEILCYHDINILVIENYWMNYACRHWDQLMIEMKLDSLFRSAFFKSYEPLKWLKVFYCKTFINNYIQKMHVYSIEWGTLSQLFYFYIAHGKIVKKFDHF